MQILLNSLNFRLLMAALAACTVTSANAQSDSLYMDVTFTGNLELQLRDANKLPVNPDLKTDSSAMTTIRYDLLPTRKNFSIGVKPIAPARINVEDRLQKLYRGYIKAGYGMWSTPLIDAYYTDGRSRKGSFGFSYNHLSSSGGVAADDSIPDGFSDNRFDFWGKYFFRKTALEGGVNWSRNVAHWYGFDPARVDAGDVDLNVLKQRLNTFGGNVRFHTYGRDTLGLNYRGDIAVRGTTDLFGGRETHVDVTTALSQVVDTERYQLQFGVNYNQFSSLPFTEAGEPERQVQDNAIIKLIPTAFTVWKDLRATAGMGLYLDARGDQPLHFYPLAELRYNILKGLLVPYAGLRGSLVQTTFMETFAENPFIQTDVLLRARNNKLEAYGGISGSASASSAFNAGVSYQQIRDFAYFINDSLRGPGNYMEVVYDDLDRLNLYGEFTLKAPEKWTAYLRGDYFIYGSTGEQAHPWHQPVLKVTATGEYNLRNKIILQTEIYYVGERWASSEFPVGDVAANADGTYHYKLDPFADVNLKGEYRYTRRLSAWVQFNNLGAVRYQRWSAYRVQRPGALMGVTWAF